MTPAEAAPQAIAKMKERSDKARMKLAKKPGMSIEKKVKLEWSLDVYSAATEALLARQREAPLTTQV
jgi:hypothetical protein